MTQIDQRQPFFLQEEEPTSGGTHCFCAFFVCVSSMLMNQGTAPEWKNS